MMSEFNGWKAKLETFVGHGLDANESAWAKWIYDNGYGPWDAFIAYQRRAYP